MESCCCEHTRHFTDQWGPQVAHDHLAVPASPGFTALYVGPICADCATDCMADYLITE
jgi:hypothetical protein